MNRSLLKEVPHRKEIHQFNFIEVEGNYKHFLFLNLMTQTFLLTYKYVCRPGIHRITAPGNCLKNRFASKTKLQSLAVCVQHQSLYHANVFKIRQPCIKNLFIIRVVSATFQLALFGPVAKEMALISSGHQVARYQIHTQQLNILDTLLRFRFTGLGLLWVK